MVSSSRKNSSPSPAERKAEENIFESRNLMAKFNHVVMQKLYPYLQRSGWEKPTESTTANYVLSWLPTSLIGKVYEPANKLATDQPNAKKVYDITQAVLELVSLDPHNRSLKVLCIFLALEKFLAIRGDCPSGFIKNPRVVKIIDETFKTFLPIEKMPITLDIFKIHKATQFKIHHISAKDEVIIEKNLNVLIAKYAKLSPSGSPLTPPTSPTTDRESDPIPSSSFESEPGRERKSAFQL